MHRVAIGFALSALMVGCKGGAGDAQPPVVEECGSPPFSDDVCIHGGSFTMGHAALPIVASNCVRDPDDERSACGPGNAPPTNFSPPHNVVLEAFFIDRDP